MEKIEIKLIRNTIVDGEAREVGDVVLVEKREATYLIALKKAKLVKDVAKDGIVAKEAATNNETTEGSRGLFGHKR